MFLKTTKFGMQQKAYTLISGLPNLNSFHILTLDDESSHGNKKKKKKKKKKKNYNNAIFGQERNFGQK